MRLRVKAHHIVFLEAALIGVFFVQALRFLIGVLYSRVAGASVIVAADPATLDFTLPGVIDPMLVSAEVSFLFYMLALPLIALILGRFRVLFIVAVVAVSLGRTLMNSGTVLTPVAASGLAVGAGLLYLALLIRHRAQMLPYFFIIGIAVDQLFRAVGNTLDPSWSPAYLPAQTALAIITVLFSVIAVIAQMRQGRSDVGVSPNNGLLPFWGALGLGALLFLELTLLAMPNAIAGRAAVDYTIFVPLVMVATVLPLMPWVRAQARAVIGLFDGGVRGWAWMLTLALLVVFGTRFPGLPGGVALVVAQFAASLMWWWLVRPRAERERSVTGLWLIVAMVIFTALIGFDYFTYEYAFVRNFSGDLAFLNSTVPPLLRGFRGLGLGVLLLGVFLAAIPMIQTQRRVPWSERRSQSPLLSLGALVLIVAFTVGGAMAARPPLVQPVRGVDSFRVGTYDIQAGFNEFYHFDLEAIARTIQQSGANVVLLQEVEAGRLTSFGVDEPLWLARRLGMDRRYFATNEGLQGLAVMSNIPIVYTQGTLLASIGNQTGLQHVQVSTDGISAVSFYNTSLGLLLAAPGERTVEEQQQDQQIQLNQVFSVILHDYADLNQVRLVVGGNFNNVPRSPLLEQMRLAGFNDPFAGRPDELAATLWRANRLARLDYLWLRNVLPLGALVMDTRASDHRMAVVEILINRVAQ